MVDPKFAMLQKIGSHPLQRAATDHAALASDIEDSHGPVTERAASASAIKDFRLETMFREACSKAPPNVQRLQQDVNTLGHYPKRYKRPADKVERASDSLAKKVAMVKGHFTSAVQKSLEAMQAASTATEHAQQAVGLMQQVRALGRMPKESYYPKECRLTHKLRDARTTGLTTSYETEL